MIAASSRNTTIKRQTECEAEALLRERSERIEADANDSIAGPGNLTS